MRIQNILLVAVFVLASLNGAMSAHAKPTSATTSGGNASYLAAPFTTRTPRPVVPSASAPIYINQKTQTFCRAYSHNIGTAGAVRESYGTACLQPDGTWHTQNK